MRAVCRLRAAAGATRRPGQKDRSNRGGRPSGRFMNLAKLWSIVRGCLGCIATILS